ncbi:MAG: type II toxin-antitoxin system HicB family antitoxin [Chloroflexi bacterium]|nr:type II toxin-antitoxin system HicB family antitoxin [Chloroflexota bacterium]
MSKKTLAYYQNLPYTIEFKQDTSDPERPVWFAQVKELPGCMTEADTLHEASEMIQDALAVWIQGSLDAGLPIPEPQPEPEYSGKFSLRLPKSLHRDLAQLAKQEGTSLNQYVNSVLSRDAGAKLSAV